MTNVGSAPGNPAGSGEELLQDRPVSAAPFFTVFTATYNRASTLHRVYDSLKRQTFRSFEWLVVDDGSEDNTRELVAGWRQAGEFPIRYYYQPNQGKHVALNHGVARARGELFLPLDSDDACTPTALERLKYHWDTIPPDRKAFFSAVTALCIDQEGRLVGSKFPQDVTDSDSLEIRYRHGVVGEKWGFHRTAVLRAYPFPEDVKRHTFPEGLVWSKIARRYKTRFVNEPLRIYYTDQPSLVNHVADPARDAFGGRALHLAVLNDEIDFFRHAPREFLRSAVHYVRFSHHLGAGLREGIARLNNALAVVLVCLAWPVGLAVYWNDRRRVRRAKAGAPSPTRPG